ncbi:TPA: hypothetical protein DCX16_06605 [bacterium]|nr:hypothetical protein [bacterium]
MEDNAYCIILVGGEGKRLWPISDKKKPKPFLPLITEKTLIEETVNRIKDIFPKERIKFVLSNKYKTLCSKIFPYFTEENYIIEPCPRDTSAAIGLSLKYTPDDSTLVVLSSDHYVSDKENFQRQILSGAKFLENNPDFVLVFGIKPKRPEAGYGYVKRKEPLDDGIFKVERFFEKPNKEDAKVYLKNPNYFWNAGIFIFRKKRMEELFSIHLPEHCKVILDSEIKDQRFKSLEKISIDYGIMEKIDTIGMIEGDFLWDDIGSYNSLSRIHRPDENKNLVFGDCTGISTKNCIIWSDNGKIVTIGVSGLVIAYCDGRVLVAKKERVDEIKGLVDIIENED